MSTPKSFTALIRAFKNVFVPLPGETRFTAHLAATYPAR
jgi:hypothetical protein